MLWSKSLPLKFAVTNKSMFIKLKFQWPFWNHQGTSHLNKHYFKVLHHFDSKFWFLITSQVRSLYGQIIDFLFCHTETFLQHPLDALPPCGFTQCLFAFLWISVRRSVTVYRGQHLVSVLNYFSNTERTSKYWSWHF